MASFSALQGTVSTILSNTFVTLPVPTADASIQQQTFIVSGANTGLGLESCRHLSRLGAGKLIMACRTPSKGEAAKRDILETTKRPESSIEVWHLDMDSYESIRLFVEQVKELDRLDGVLANAGIMTRNFRLSEGFEASINVNVIATFYLYLLLAPKMRESGKKTGNLCRFTVPNSALHFLAQLNHLQPKSGAIMEELNDAEKSDMGDRYNLTKLLIVYATREFAERDAASGKPRIIVNTPNPSFCKSNLADELKGDTGMQTFENLLARSTEEGSRALVHGVLCGEESNGQYLTNCHVQA